MVLMNGSKKARYENSIVNQKQGGGPKKAGLVPTAILPAAKWIGYNNRGYPRSMAVMNMPLVSTVRQSRPIATRPENWLAGNH